MASNEVRIAVTMRESNAQGYVEFRDALARNWIDFLDIALPEALWLPVPNMGAEAVSRYWRKWRLNGLILTGGEDIGFSKLRDETEKALLEIALDQECPILGVCRGLQMMWNKIGGKMRSVGGHVACRHSVKIEHANFFTKHDINSYHGNGLFEDEGLREDYAVFARAEDGEIEGVEFRRGQMIGMMWHPERETFPAAYDVALIRKLFDLEA
ncbi:N5-(cytidine 5'-diphosphoramidyl)-L-glutamine hydrolase [Azospirillaceae bacterium]